MKKPVIGLVPLVDRERESLWMLPGYMEGIASAGGIGLMLPLNDDEADLEQLALLCDGFIFTGGHDISPELYGQRNEGLCGEIIPGRDAMETKLMALVLEQDKGVLGICRGMQFLNVHLGGTLYQDLPTQFPGGMDHRQSRPYDRPAHRVAARGLLAQTVESEELRVNSCHHQGIRDLAKGLEVMAAAPDGLIEAVRMPGKRFVWAVQWHPEFLYRTDPPSRAILRAFVDGCR